MGRVSDPEDSDEIDEARASTASGSSYSLRTRSTKHEPVFAVAESSGARDSRAQEAVQRSLVSTEAPTCLWCYAGEWVAQILSHTVHDMATLAVALLLSGTLKDRNGGCKIPRRSLRPLATPKTGERKKWTDAPRKMDGRATKAIIGRKYRRVAMDGWMSRSWS